MDAVLEGISRIEEEENLVVRTEDRGSHYLQIWSYTAFCNWLDVVEIRFHSQGPSKCCSIEQKQASTMYYYSRPCN